MTPDDEAMMMNAAYLGDGLYAKHDGFQFILLAPREGGVHYVALESEVLENFLEYIERHSNVTIKVEKK